MQEILLLVLALAADAFAASVGLGSTMLGWFAAGASWIAFFILVALGIKMLYESRSVNDDDTQINLSHRTMLKKYTQMYTGSIQERTPIEITWTTAKDSNIHYGTALLPITGVMKNDVG